jgi:hypothetical protein
MVYPEHATRWVGILELVSGIILLVSLLVGGCIRKADDEE